MLDSAVGPKNSGIEFLDFDRYLTWYLALKYILYLKSSSQLGLQELYRNLNFKLPLYVYISAQKLRRVVRERPEITSVAILQEITGIYRE